MFLTKSILLWFTAIILVSSSIHQRVLAVVLPDEHRLHFDSVEEFFPTLRPHHQTQQKSGTTASTIFSTPPQLDDFPSSHEDNWAVVVSSSKYWHNFRQSNNAFTLYNLLRSQGFPDDHIILFVSENHACDAQRNPDPGFTSCGRSTDFPNASAFGADVEIDFSGYGADAMQFTRLLLGTQDAEIPNGKTLRSTSKSNVLLYISSHSGEYFTKFQDYEFLSSFELNQAFELMYRLGRYQRLFFMIDTCKGSTLFDNIDAPNVVSVSSSGPVDDGMAHAEQFNMRLSGSSNDALTSEVFDFVATILASENSNNKIVVERELQKVAPGYSFQQNSGLNKVTVRKFFDFVQSNKYIRSRASVSHSAALYRNANSPDVLANGNWLFTDFFSFKSTNIDARKKNLIQDMEQDFFIWESI